jgi:hypothetical protein
MLAAAPVVIEATAEEFGVGHVAEPFRDRIG